MGKNQSASNLTNIIQYNNGNISFVSGSTTLMQISSSGAITTTGVISGSNALSASYAATASFVTLAQTASFVTTAQTASFVANAQSASNAVTAQTASFANTFTVASTLTAQTLVVQTITSSVDFVTGSTRFGSLSSNTHVFTGSLNITGGLAVNAGNPTIGTSASTGVAIRFQRTNASTGSIGSITSDITGYTDIAGIDLFAENVGGGTQAGSIRFNTSNAAVSSEKMRIATSGNVGIGITSPVGKLDINTGANTNIVISNDSVDTGYNIVSLNGTRTKGSYAGIAGGGTGDNNLYLNSGNDVVIQTGASYTGRVRVTSGGNVGIGTTSPTRRLHIRSTDDTRGLLIDQTSTTSYSEVHFLASREYRIGTGGSSSASEAANNWYVYDSTAALQRFVINSSGNVGIGTTNPNNLLSVKGNLDLGATGLSYVGPGQYGAIMFPRGQILFSNSNTQNQLYLASNAYTNASGVFAYRNSNQPALYIGMDNGAIGFGVAGNGTADATISWTTAMGINNSGIVTRPTQPAFLAYSSDSGFTVTGNGWYNVSNAMTVEAYDISSNYSGGRFTAPVAGRYFFYAGGWANIASNGERYAFCARVNDGGLTFIGGGNYSLGDSPLSGYTVVYNLAAGDFVDLWVFSAVSGTWGSGSHRAYWGGYLL